MGSRHFSGKRPGVSQTARGTRWWLRESRKGRTFLAEQEDEYYEDEADEEGDEEEDENPVLALLEDEMMQAAAEITKVTNTMAEKGEDETVFAAMEGKKKTCET